MTRNLVLHLLAMMPMLALSGCGEQPAGEAAQPAAAPQRTVTEMPRTPSPEGAKVFFISPANGDTVASPLTVEFGIDGMNVVAAGVNEPYSGHHHLLIDTGLPDLGMPIPADANHVHFGNAATSTRLELAPGTHTLQLLLGDHLHVPHVPPVISAPITITVE